MLLFISTLVLSTCWKQKKLRLSSELILLLKSCSLYSSDFFSVLIMHSLNYSSEFFFCFNHALFKIFKTLFKFSWDKDWLLSIPDNKDKIPRRYNPLYLRPPETFLETEKQLRDPIFCWWAGEENGKNFYLHQLDNAACLIYRFVKSGSQIRFTVKYIKPGNKRDFFIDSKFWWTVKCRMLTFLAALIDFFLWFHLLQRLAARQEERGTGPTLNIKKQ